MFPSERAEQGRQDRKGLKVVFGLMGLAALAVISMNNGHEVGATPTTVTASKSVTVKPITERPVDFTARDIETIVAVSRQNELRFNRDYKGRVFSDMLTFKSMTENTFGSDMHVSFRGAYFFVSDKAMQQRMIEWNKGHRAKVTGVIKTTMFGDIALTNVVISEN